jgi:hypothetical protein
MSIKLHIDNWISKAELDYYTMFIKAWIPFNAWYFSEYNTKKDSVALTQIKTTKNKVRNRIEALLLNSDSAAKAFKFHLSQLHLQLESRSIMNYGKLVKFTAVSIDGLAPKPATDVDKKGNIYKAIPNKSSGYRVVIVDKSNKTLLDKNFNPYDYDAFITDNQYLSLKDTNVQARIRFCFAEINPERLFDLLSKSKIKSEFIELDTDNKIRFITDTEIIAKGIIEILYVLRCVLFHGELDPTAINHAVYEHAYYILKPLIQELK